MPLHRKVFHRFIPYNAKIADISEPDTAKHTLDLEATLGETRKIIAVIVYAARVSGTGTLIVYPNEGTYGVSIIWSTSLGTIVIKDGTQRLQYAQTVANDEFDLICVGYIVEG